MIDDIEKTSLSQLLSYIVTSRDGFVERGKIQSITRLF